METSQLTFRSLLSLGAELDNELEWLEFQHLVKPRCCSCTGRVPSFLLTQHLLQVKISQEAQKYLFPPSFGIFLPPQTLGTLGSTKSYTNKLYSPELSKAWDQSESPPEQHNLPLAPPDTSDFVSALPRPEVPMPPVLAAGFLCSQLISKHLTQHSVFLLLLSFTF